MTIIINIHNCSVKCKVCSSFNAWLHCDYSHDSTSGRGYKLRPVASWSAAQLACGADSSVTIISSMMLTHIRNSTINNFNILRMLPIEVSKSTTGQLCFHRHTYCDIVRFARKFRNRAIYVKLPEPRPRRSALRPRRLPFRPRRDRDETLGTSRDRLETETSRPRPHPWPIYI